MSNEQRAHDLTMLYVEMLCNIQQPNENDEVKLDPLSKYIELYPQILEKINNTFSK